MDPKKMCQCGTSFAELSAAALKRPEAERVDDWTTGESSSPGANGKSREASREGPSTGGG